MIYVKSILAGLALLLGCVALSVFGVSEWYDLRAIMGAFPLISLPTMLAIFAVGFLWQFRRTSKPRTR